MESTPIKLICQIYKIQTMADGGSRITLDCGDESMNAVVKLMELKSSGETNLAAAFVVYE